jgi:hypothetical protein
MAILPSFLPSFLPCRNEDGCKEPFRSVYGRCTLVRRSAISTQRGDFISHSWFQAFVIGAPGTDIYNSSTSGLTSQNVRCLGTHNRELFWFGLVFMYIQDHFERSVVFCTPAVFSCSRMTDKELIEKPYEWISLCLPGAMHWHLIGGAVENHAKPYSR